MVILKDLPQASCIAWASDQAKQEKNVLDTPVCARVRGHGDMVSGNLPPIRNSLTGRVLSTAHRKTSKSCDALVDDC